jgi:LPXTG-motif cell wall-anchored protein
VTLTLTGPDGEPVTDVFGNPVGSVVTDGNGFYEFVNLPALAPGESYTVTVTPPAGYVPTTPGVGDSAGDSSTGSATSGDLVNDGDRDDTLDFGFVPVPEDPPGEEPPGEDPPGEDPPGETPQTSGRLPATGAVGTQVVQIALLLLVAGTGIVLGVRRRRTET